MILFFYLCVAWYQDVLEYRISNEWIVYGCIIGAIYEIAESPLKLDSLLLGFAMVSVLLPLFYLRVLGGGDIKIFYVSVLFLGSSVLRLILLSFIFNGVYALCKVLTQGDLFSRLQCFLQYLYQCKKDGKVTPYQSISELPELNQIHFMVGVLAAYVFLMC